MANADPNRPRSGLSAIRVWRAADLEDRSRLEESARLAQRAFTERDGGAPRAALTRAIRSERINAATRRGTYDVARHIALVRALRGLAKREGAPRR
ncbi:hypothetical protein E8L99_12795 [Phreatobacter aquaticus]|uniref:Uncharacterized protein n=1 Tax=Phreatobacter aquaticus TaxID=2570229 RepID=A0A4D7QR55_9HYPH|nr:hypothetical protein [Phreatobacter aquaticus]QCK86572.1 hypothetical protein E8L99_12795 [Phreatobacter aquaticus]